MEGEMSMKLQSIGSIDKSTLQGVLGFGDVVLPIKVVLSGELPIRAMSIHGPTEHDTVRLYHAPMFQSLCKTIWQYVDGVTLMFPVDIVEP